MAQQHSTHCTCPSLHDVFREGVGTKKPCPVHETPEMLAALAEIIQPAIPLGEFKIARVRRG